MGIMNMDFGDSLGEKDFVAILNAIPASVIVAKNTGGDNTAANFQLIFYNDACKSSIPSNVLDSQTLRDASSFLPPDVPWSDLIDKVMNNIPIEPVTYHSGLSNAWFRLHMKKALGSYIVVVLENLTQEKKEDEALQKTAFIDMVTGIPNRNKFKADIQSIIENAQFNGTKLGFLLLDIDNMKNINDYSGHDKGDQVLRHCVEVLQKFAKNIVQSYRFGGDEFIVIIKNSSTTDSITNTCDAILEAFNSESIYISGGLSLYPDDSTDKDDIMRFSDIAMQHSKRNGKNRITIFDVDMHREFVQKFNMQLRMVKGIINGEFYLVFQPQFVIKTGELRGFEALLRWDDAGTKEVEPDLFIPVAEESGLIVELGKFVFEKSFSTLKGWETNYNFLGTMSINISVAQVIQTDFVANLRVLSEKYEVPPNRVEIEVTEGLVATNSKEIIAKLKELRAAGFRLSLDNFGAQYSSLNYLQALPLNTLKIDKSFIDDLSNTSDIKAMIANSVISLVQKLGLETVAEGVEQKSQLEILKNYNCNIVQGFLRGKPMTLEDCNNYLSGKTTNIAND